MKSSISGACARSVCLSATKESTFKEVNNLSVYMRICSCTVYVYLGCLSALLKSLSSAITESSSSSKSPQIIITDYGSDSSTFNFILPSAQKSHFPETFCDTQTNIRDAIKIVVDWLKCLLHIGATMAELFVSNKLKVF